MTDDVAQGTAHRIIPREARRWYAGKAPLIPARDFTGAECWVEVPPLQRDYIPEGWQSLTWFVVAVSRRPSPPSLPSNERCALAELTALGFPAILPVEVVKRKARCGEAAGTKAKGKRAARGWQHVAQPLFPGYLLVGFAGNDLAALAERLMRIAACRHVAGLLGTREGADRPVGLTRRGFERFAKAYNEGWFDESVKAITRPSDPKIGSLVEILDGPFEEFTGFVTRFRKKSEGGKALITAAFVELEVLGARRDVEIDVDSLKLVP